MSENVNHGVQGFGNFTGKIDELKQLMLQVEEFNLFGNVAKHIKTDGLKEMRCVVNYWPFTIAYFVLSMFGLYFSVRLSVFAAESIGQEWITGILFSLFGGFSVALAVWATDALALRFSSMRVLFEKRKITIKKNEYDLVGEIYDIRQSPLIRRKVVVYGLRTENGVAKPWLYRFTFLREAQAHFFVRYVEHLHMQAATGATKEQSDRKDRNARDT